MNRFFFIFFKLLIIINLYGFTSIDKIQDPDSLLDQYNDKSVSYLIQLARNKSIHDFDSAEAILLAANKMADSLKETSNKVNALIMLGHLYFENGYFENAGDIFNQILNNFSSDITDQQLAEVKHAAGLNHIKFNNYDKAINYLQEALFFYEKSKNKLEIARVLKDIGAMYYHLGNEKSALENYQKSLLIYRELDNKDGIAMLFNNIGLIFKAKGNIVLALEYLNQALEIKKEQENQFGIANTLGNIGDVYMKDKQYEKAIWHFKEALRLWLILDYLYGTVEVYNYLGEVYIRKGNYNLAIENLQKALKISEKHNYKQRLIVTYELLSEAYFEQNDFKNAIQNYRQYNVLKDSLYEAITNQRIEEYLVKYENLKAENELIEQNRKINKQRLQILLILSILIITIIFLFLLIRQNRSIKRKSYKIQKINRELDLRVNQKTSELRMSQFSIDIAVDAIFWMKKDGSFNYINAAACSLLGYTKDELNKMTIFEIVPEFSQDIWMEYWDQLKRKGSYVIQLYYKTKMGSEIPVEAAFNFQKFEGEEYNFNFSRNISERKISEEKLKNAKDKAERSDKLKSAFLANMSHEIRTPMNAITGFINLLGDSEIATQQKEEIVELAQASSNDLLNIINDIIDISKIEADELAINKSLGYVNGLMNNIYKFYLKDINILQKGNISFKLELEEDGNRMAILTDQYRFRQIIHNFINNAIKFTEDGEICIGYKQITKGGRKLLKFFVRDTGIGIPLEKQSIVFDRFNQLIESRTKNYKGTGLGLAISKKLAELLGGEIGVESKVGSGSEFFFILPYQMLDTPDISISEDSFQKRKINWEDKVILIVEDTPSNYYLIENYLKPTKAKLYWAKTGMEAIDLFKQKEKFDLVLMDIQLPGINGYEATKLIKAHNKNVPVIAQTAYALSGERDFSISEGCDDYISKPIKKEVLIEMLDSFFQ